MPPRWPALLWLAGFGSAALLVPLFGLDPLGIEVARVYAPPGPGHWLGCDELGRDLLARLLYAGRTSLALAFLAAPLTVALGGMAGLLAGYLGGFAEILVMRAGDGLASIPRLPVLLILSGLAGGGPETLLLLWLIFGWVQPARLVRARVTELRSQGFVAAAVGLGFGPLRIVFGHVLPNALGPVWVTGAQSLGEVLLYEGVLSYLGLGIAAPAPSFGNLLRVQWSAFDAAPWLWIAPGAVMTATVASFHALAEGLRRTFRTRG